jgi:hypothetical protein
MGQEMSLGHPRPYHRLCRCRRIRLGGNEKLMNPASTRTHWTRPLILITDTPNIHSNSTPCRTYISLRQHLICTSPHRQGNSLSLGLFAFSILGNYHHLYPYDLHTFTLLCIIHETHLREDCIYTYFVYLSQRDPGIWNVLFGLIMRTSELIVNRIFISCKLPSGRDH